MAVSDAHILIVVSGVGTRINVEHDASRRLTAVDAVDPLATV